MGCISTPTMIFFIFVLNSGTSAQPPIDTTPEYSMSTEPAKTDPDTATEQKTVEQTSTSNTDATTEQTTENLTPKPNPTTTTEQATEKPVSTPNSDTTTEQTTENTTSAPNPTTPTEQATEKPASTPNPDTITEKTTENPTSTPNPTTTKEQTTEHPRDTTTTTATTQQPLITGTCTNVWNFLDLCKPVDKPYFHIIGLGCLDKTFWKMTCSVINNGFKTLEECEQKCGKSIIQAVFQACLSFFARF